MNTEGTVRGRPVEILTSRADNVDGERVYFWIRYVDSGAEGWVPSRDVTRCPAHPDAPGDP